MFNYVGEMMQNPCPNSKQTHYFQDVLKGELSYFDERTLNAPFLHFYVHT